MGVAPFSLARFRIVFDRPLIDIVLVFAIPSFQAAFPAPGLPPGLYLQQIPTDIEQFLSGPRFGVKGQFGSGVKPGMEPATLDNCLRPTDGQSLQKAFLAVTNNVVWFG